MAIGVWGGAPIIKQAFSVSSLEEAEEAPIFGRGSSHNHLFKLLICFLPEIFSVISGLDIITPH